MTKADKIAGKRAYDLKAITFGFILEVIFAIFFSWLAISGLRDGLIALPLTYFYFAAGYCFVIYFTLAEVFNA